MTTGKNNLLKAFAIVLVVHAASPAFAEGYLGTLGRIAGDGELAEIRGGYVAGDGLEISFGIEKSVLINGVLQTVNMLNIPQMGGMASASPTDDIQGNIVKLVQSGIGNSVSPSVLSSLQSGLFTFIQNSMDGASIRNLTNINATVNVLSLYRSINMNSMMNQQLISSMR